MQVDDKENYKTLKKEYEKAVAEGKETFNSEVFDGQEVLTKYVKYVLEFVEKYKLKEK